MIVQKCENKVVIKGLLKQPFAYDKVDGNRRIFSSVLVAMRPSGRHDEIPVSIEESLLDSINLDEFSENIQIKGHIMGGTFNHKLNICVRIEEIMPTYNKELVNSVKMFGEIASEVVTHQASNGEIFCHFILVTSIDGIKREYVPVTAWNKVALLINTFTVGHELQFDARFQSRKYKKFYTDGSFEEKETCELVIMRLKI